MLAQNKALCAIAVSRDTFATVTPEEIDGAAIARDGNTISIGVWYAVNKFTMMPLSDFQRYVSECGASECVASEPIAA